MTVLRICFIGDSVTVGTGDAACRGWPSYLSALETDRGHDVSCYNLGVRAETSLDLAKRWKAEATPRLPDHVAGKLVFMVGLNDCADFNGTGARVDPALSLETAKTMVADAAGWKPTLWIGPTPVRKQPPMISPGEGIRYTFDRVRTSALNDAYRTAAEEIGVPFLDLHAPLAEDAGWNADMEAGDGVHPTQAGHERLADVISGWDAWRGWF